MSAALTLAAGGRYGEGQFLWAWHEDGGRRRWEITRADPRVVISDELYDAARRGLSPYASVRAGVVTIWDDFGHRVIYVRRERLDEVPGYLLEWPD